MSEVNKEKLACISETVVDWYDSKKTSYTISVGHNVLETKLTVPIRLQQLNADKFI